MFQLYSKFDLETLYIVSYYISLGRVKNMKKSIMLLITTAIFGSLIIGSLSAPIQQGSEQKNENIESIPDEFTSLSQDPKPICQGDPDELGGGFRGNN